jgi:hypothetical protein
MASMVGKDYGFGKPEVFSSQQVEDPGFYRSRRTSHHIENYDGSMPYGCERVDADALIRQVLQVKVSGD